ncbi:MAG: EAL domain-containing protein [Nitrosomonadales bacterium]|nr:EAL domain-containing protein [Nitrosomonadales bacterium]
MIDTTRHDTLQKQIKLTIAWLAGSAVLIIALLVWRTTKETEHHHILYDYHLMSVTHAEAIHTAYAAITPPSGMHETDASTITDRHAFVDNVLLQYQKILDHSSALFALDSQYADPAMTSATQSLRDEISALQHLAENHGDNHYDFALALSRGTPRLGMISDQLSRLHRDEFLSELAEHDRQILFQWAALSALALSLLTGTIMLLRRNFSAIDAARSHERQAMHAMQRSEQKFRALFNSTSDAVILMTGKQVIDCNKSTLTLFGCSSSEEFYAKFPAELSAPEQPFGPGFIPLADWQNNVLKHNNGGYFEWLHKRADTGATFYAEVLIDSMVIDGQAVLQATIRDITRRKQTEQALQESESRFRAIIEATPVPLALNDGQGNITFLNQAFTETLGYTLDDIPTLAEWWPRAYPDPQYRQRVMDSWQHNLAEAQRAGTPFSPLELEITREDGRRGTFLVGAADLQGSFSGIHLVTLYDITSLKVAEQEIRTLAFYDPLTHLPNRRLLLDRLNHALLSSTRSGRSGALLFIDLDHFKDLNDTLGHDIGDLLLQQVAQRLASCVREDDTVARLGGDEFVVMLENLSEYPIEAATQTEVIGDKILASLNQPFQLAQYEFLNSSSIGATLFHGQQQTVEELLKQADIAMYQSKAAGRNTLRFFDPQMQASISERVALEGDLRQALAGNQFQLYYQLQIDHAGHAVGAEALIRWLHPQRGMVSPGVFIPLAEETGLILPIGAWVMQTACAQIKQWELNPLTRDLQLAVNISARQFHQPDFVAQVDDTLNNSAIKPDRLKLEMTESLVLSDIDDTIAKMQELRKRGVCFSMDDFGTGHSSLSSLRKLPLDQLKIDQSFVRDITTDPDDAVIVQTIIAMAQNLGMEVIAEGVETEPQRAFLQQHGCDTYQGYLFSKPLPLAQFEELLTRL